MARELSDLGFNVNFGPVVDLNINPDSPAIGRLGRTYDQGPAKVTAYARQFIKAHEQAGVLTVLKHFPGHGSALADSHDGIVNISKTWRLTELDPYKDLIAGNFVQMVMVGHLIHPLFSDNGDRPASLSRLAITDTLRGALGFRGLVVTDDLNMRAIRDHYAIEEAAAMAVAAGSDLVLVANQSDPAIADKITEAILGAITEGRISVSQIEEAYARITKAKSELLLLSSIGPLVKPRVSTRPTTAGCIHLEGCPPTNINPRRWRRSNADKMAGLDVISIHRLLKNAVNERFASGGWQWLAAGDRATLIIEYDRLEIDVSQEARDRVARPGIVAMHDEDLAEGGNLCSRFAATGFLIFAALAFQSR